MSEALMGQPAYRILTPRLVLRCWTPQDAAMAKEAIDSSLEHLRPWMPWVQFEPTDLETKINLMRSFRSRFDRGEDFVYGIFNSEETQVLGGSGLHPRIGEKALEIGYWIRSGQINQGLATEAASALVKVAFEVARVDRVEIHCQPSNVRSAAVPRKLGFTHEATLRRRASFLEDMVDSMIWVLFAEDYPRSPASQILIQVFDAAGREIPL